MTLKELLTPFYISIVENETRRSIGDFLSQRLVDLKFVFISFWSAVHLLAGGSIFFLIDKFSKGRTVDKFVSLFLVLLVYEVVEYFLYMNLSMLFIVEPAIDLIWDLVIGMLGGALVWFFGK